MSEYGLLNDRELCINTLSYSDAVIRQSQLLSVLCGTELRHRWKCLLSQMHKTSH